MLPWENGLIMANDKASDKKQKRNPLAGLSRSEPPTHYVDTLGTGRKRRKDATGHKKDYHTGTTTLAVRIPDDLANQVKKQANAEGISVNAWLATLIETALEE